MIAPYADKGAAWLRSALLMSLHIEGARDGWSDPDGIWSRSIGEHILVADEEGRGVEWRIYTAEQIEQWRGGRQDPILSGKCPTLMEAADGAEAAYARLVAAL